MINDSFIIIFFILINLVLTIFFNKINIFQTNLDIPDTKRKFHIKKIPRAGGILFFINVITYNLIIGIFSDIFYLDVIFKNYYSLTIFSIVFSLIFLLGYLDDKYNFKPNLKFSISAFLILLLLLLDKRIIISVIDFSFYQNLLDISYVSILFTIFCFLVFLNAFNMFDGFNLQATSYSLIICSYILLFLINTLFIKILIIFLIFFLYLNYKNKSFLGDSGSLSIAFVISYTFISLYNQNIIKFADQVIIFMIIPGLDLIRLFIFRIIRKKNPLSSDRNHLHHVLLLKYSEKKTLFIILGLIIFPIILNFINFNNFFTIILTTIFYTITIYSLSKNN